MFVHAHVRVSTSHLFELLVEHLADRVRRLDLPSQDRGQHVTQSHHPQDQTREGETGLQLHSQRSRYEADRRAGRQAGK